MLSALHRVETSQAVVTEASQGVDGVLHATLLTAPLVDRELQGDLETADVGFHGVLRLARQDQVEDLVLQFLDDVELGDDHWKNLFFLLRHCTVVSEESQGFFSPAAVPVGDLGNRRLFGEAIVLSRAVVAELSQLLEGGEESHLRDLRGGETILGADRHDELDHGSGSGGELGHFRVLIVSVRVVYRDSTQKSRTKLTANENNYNCCS